MIERATKAVAIDRVAAADSEQRHRDVLADAINPIVHRPGQQTGAGHRIGGLGKIAADIDARDERLGAEHVGDETGRDLRHVVGADRAEGEAGTGDGGGEEDDLAAAGHGLSPGYGRICPGGSGIHASPARRIWNWPCRNCGGSGRIWIYVDITMDWKSS